jgi:type IV pilus assembly protein PilV
LVFGGAIVAQVSSPRSQRGVSLIEVLMAVLIFCIGLIGLAGLLVMATRSNHTAYIRTQVTFLAGSMADRMRANPYAVWENKYDSDVYPLTLTETKCDATTSCAPENVAKRDQWLWSTMLKDSLPGVGKTSIKCDKSKAGFDPVSQIGMRPPYGGSCTMTITWAERGVADSDDRTDATKTGLAGLQSFTWVFQP